MERQTFISEFVNEEGMAMKIYKQHNKITDKKYGLIHYHVFLARNPEDNDEEFNRYKPDDIILAIIEDKKFINFESFCYLPEDLDISDIEQELSEEDIYNIIKKKFQHTKDINTDYKILQKWYSDINDGVNLTSEMKEFREGNIPKPFEIKTAGSRLFPEDLKKIEEDKKRKDATKIFD